MTLIEVLEHIPPPQVERFVYGLSTYISDGGTLLLTVPHANKPVQSKHYQHFSTALLRESLEPHFEIQEIVYFDRDSRKLRYLEALMQNRLFVLNHSRLTTAFFNYYIRTHLVTDEASCGRMLAVATVRR